MNESNHHHCGPVVGGRRLMTTRDYKRVMGNPSEMKLWRDERRGVGPKPVRVNGRRYWFEDEVATYLGELAASRREENDEAPTVGGADAAADRIAAAHTSEGTKGD